MILEQWTNYSAIEEALVQLIIRRNLPDSAIEWPELSALLHLCNPTVSKNLPDSRKRLPHLIETAEAERVFSGARRTISWERARLEATRIERGECLKSWLREGIIRGISSTTMAEIIAHVERWQNGGDDDVIDELDELLETANQVARVSVEFSFSINSESTP
jgi:hypothetical protein